MDERTHRAFNLQAVLQMAGERKESSLPVVRGICCECFCSEFAVPTGPAGLCMAGSGGQWFFSYKVRCTGGLGYGSAVWCVHETESEPGNPKTMSVWKYADRITPIEPGNRISLGEGQTPLVRSRKIGPNAGLDNLYFKLEGTNPTGSFKDRYAAVAISHMLQTGKSECIATSSGNTGAALAAYSAAAGTRCRIAVVEPAPTEKLAQMLAYGAGIFKVRGFGLNPDIDRRTFQALRKLARKPGRVLEVSAYVFSPQGMCGVETLSFELAEQLNNIQHVFCPAGGGGLAAGVARGFAALVEQKDIPGCPAVHCVQPEGNDTISTRLRDGSDRAQKVQSTSRISGLQVSTVTDGHLAIEFCRPTGGTGYLVTDESVWLLQKRLAREEGIFAEPAGAVAVAGVLKAANVNEISKSATTVCIISGTGFKDTVAVDRMNEDADCPTVDLSVLESEVV